MTKDQVSQRAVNPGATGAGNEVATASLILVMFRLNPKKVKGLQPPLMKQATGGDQPLS